MGYRSDVAIGMAFDNREALVAFLSSVKLSGVIQPGELAHYTVTDVTHGVLLHTYFDNVKWYDSYPDVQCHVALLGAASDYGAGTAFIRIGEEMDDTEYEIHGSDSDSALDLYDMFGVTRKIDAPSAGVSISDFINTKE